ncbi:MAG: hypothetical protein ACRDN6_07270 [Gaiellaceae bacterium]
MTFASVLPRRRAAEEVIAEIDLGRTGGATEASRARVAELELHIDTGDDHYGAGRYEAALEEFKTARALIYELLNPEFDVHAFRRRRGAVLPVSAELERSLLEVSVSVADAIRPRAVETRPVFTRETQVAVPDALKPLVKTGFRETLGEESLQRAGAQGVALIEDGKPEAAIELMEDALAKARELGNRADRTLSAVLELNLAGAYLQILGSDKAGALAAASQRDFEAAGDLIGQAQAVHLAGVAASRAGRKEEADALLARAAALLKRAEQRSGSERPPVREPPSPERLAPFSPVPGRRLSPTALPALTLGDGHIATRVVSSRDLADLKPIADMDPQTVTLRLPGRTEGWTVLPLPDNVQREKQSRAWEIGVLAGGKLATFTMAGGTLPSADDVIKAIYQPRVAAKKLKDLEWTIVDASTTTFYLTHLYAYALPVKIGDAERELGRYAQAEQAFLQAAAYTYLNREIEATAVWLRLARTALAAGDALYRAEDLPRAKAEYEKLITTTGGVPGGLLYATASLVVPADEARTLIGKLAERPLPDVNWEIAEVVLTAYGQLQQILDGLDFYGLVLSPIHTFEYLQSIARGFAQEAIQAEREFVNFKSHAEMEASTRRDLQAAKSMAQAEADARYQQLLAAQEDESAAQRALDLAVKRRDDAVSQRSQYASASATQIWAAAAAQAQGMGEDSWYHEISALADKLARGESISGPRGKLAAAYTLHAGRKSRDYELKRMQDNIDELTRGIGIAQDQWDAAKRRRAVAEIGWQAGLQRAQFAAASLTAFENEFFTPETWSKMGDVLRDISRSYLFRAIRIAKLMERAYNFENDSELELIKNEYGEAVATEQAGRDTRLLGGDSLLSDIESFTYHAITTKTRKASRIKDVLSLSSLYPAQFEEFRRTGLLAFETDLYEFDRLHPGFYGQRIEAVELEVIGVLPETGLNGTLTAGGVSSFRKRDGSSQVRVHQVDTLALSDFVLREDIFLYSAETGVRGLFQGLGLGTTWQLHLPKRSNDFDFRRIFDLQLSIYYSATFEAALRSQVLTTPPRPGELAFLRTYGLRYDFPDAWYGFYRDGETSFALDRFKLPMNQQSFKVRAASFRVVTKPGVSSKNIDLEVTAPGRPAATVKTNVDGVVSTDDAPLAPIKGTSPLGTWDVAVRGGPSVTEGGVLKFDRVYNVQLGLEYEFEYVPEAAV